MPGLGLGPKRNSPRAEGDQRGQGATGTLGYSREEALGSWEEKLPASCSIEEWAPSRGTHLLLTVFMDLEVEGKPRGHLVQPLDFFWIRKL